MAARSVGDAPGERPSRSLTVAVLWRAARKRARQQAGVAMALAAISFACTALEAEQGVLILHATDPRNRPIPGIILSTRGDGSTGPPTDRAGKTRVRLAPQTRPNGWVSVQIVRALKDLVFISPWDQRVRVPPFENESENFAPVVLGERGDRALLEQRSAVASIAARVCAASAPKNADATAGERERRAALAEVSRLFALDPEETHGALRSLGSRSKDPYEKGMAALYQLDYPDATRDLTQALQDRKRRLKPVAAGIVNAALFLGQALYEQGKYAEAADAYREALARRPDDPDILNALGLSLLKDGKAAAAEPILRRALELERQAGK